MIMATPPTIADTRLRASWTETRLTPAFRGRSRRWRDRRPIAATPAAASAAGPAFPGTPRESVFRASHSPRHLFSHRQSVLAHRHRRRTERQELNEIFREHQIEGPIDRDPALLLESRQLAEVNRSPEP